MRAADIEPGTEYVTCTQDPLDAQTWASKERVRVLEAGVPGWARSHSYIGSNPIKGKVDTSKGARNDHALVVLIDRDYDAERTINDAEFERLVDILKGTPEYPDLSQGARREAISYIQRTQAKADPIWVEAGQERVRLRDIKMTWDTFSARVAAAQKAKNAQRQMADAFDARLDAISARLEAFTGLTVERKRFSLGYHGGVHKAVVIQGADLLQSLEQLLEEAGL